MGGNIQRACKSGVDMHDVWSSKYDSGLKYLHTYVNYAKVTMNCI